MYNTQIVLTSGALALAIETPGLSIINHGYANGQFSVKGS